MDLAGIDHRKLKNVEASGSVWNSMRDGRRDVAIYVSSKAHICGRHVSSGRGSYMQASTILLNLQR